MKLQHAVNHPSRCFSWKSNTGVAEASDFGRQRIADLIYDDAIDQGFVVCSGRTGKEIMFAHHHDDRQDGELAGSWYYSLPDRLHREGGEFKILIIND